MANYVEENFVNSDGSLGATRVLKESLAGSHNFDTLETNPPASGSRTAVVIAQDNRPQYTPEAVRTVNPMQFVPKDASNNPIQLFFHPNYSLAIDDLFGSLSVADRLLIGLNCFNTASLTQAQRGQIPAKSGMYYVGESAVHQELEGYGFYHVSLSQYEARIQQTFEGVGLPNGTLVNFNRLIFNIENSQFWIPGNGVQLPGFDQAGWNNTGKYPDWNVVKNDSIVCETDGVTRTFGDLAAMGQNAWVNELWYTRRINRLAIMLQVAKQKSAAGAIITYGTSMKQGYPITDDGGGLFIDGNCNVTHVRCTNGSGQETGATGDGNGNVTLNGRSYQIQGSFYSYETADQGYWYLFGPPGYKDSSWNQTTNYIDLWPKLNVEHVTACEKGYLQEIRRKMRQRRADGGVVGIMRQMEGIYEGNETRCPFPNMQGVGGETPKMLQPPYYLHSAYVVSRFFSGNDDPGNGMYFFPMNTYDPNVLTKPLTDAVWDRWAVHLHNIMAVIQARFYMQPFERWYTGTTLVEDIEIKIAGSFVATTGKSAYKDGNASTAVPTGSARYKQLGNGDVEIGLTIGHWQDFGLSRTDEVRLPGGILGNNSFKVTYSGPWTRAIRFTIPAGTTGQVIDLGNVGVPAWEPAGYAGRTQFSS